MTLIDLAGKQLADSSRVFPGAIVVLKGITRGAVIPGLVTRVWEPDILMTDVDGEEVAWDGRLPIIDAIIVQAAIEGDLEDAVRSRSRGEPLHVSKVPWAGDVERRASWKGLPPLIVATAPRYIVVGEIAGV